MGYTPIRIKTIKPSKKISFDLFIHFKEQYLKYKDNGFNLDKELLKKLQAQKVANFFINDTHEGAYQKYLDEVLQGLADSDEISVEEKSNITEGVTSRAIEKMQKNPTSRASYEASTKAVKNLREVISKNPEALKTIFGRTYEGNDQIIKHSLNVCMLVTKLGENEKIDDENLDNLAVAALLHDIGISQLKEDQKKLFFKMKSEFTVEDRKIYFQHPKLSTNLLQDKPYVTPNVLDLIFNYGENLEGKGPQGKTKLSKEEEILSLANCYDKKIIAEKMTPKQALKDFQINELGRYSLEMINGLKDLVKKEGLLDL